MVTIILLVLILVCSLLITSCFLWLGARWAKVSGVTYRKATFILLNAAVLAALVQFGCWYLGESSLWLSLIGGLAGFLVGPLTIWLFIAWMFRVSLWRAILAWLPTLPAVGINLAVVFLVVKPFVLEFFIIPTNAMAPTLLGPHLLAACPHCGGSLAVPYEPERSSIGGLPYGELGICVACLQAAPAERPQPEVHPPDRAVCNHLLFPRRWDLVVFRSPQNPLVKYVKRLVGLPGEQVVIRDGGIWINGARLQQPDDIASLKFADKPAGLEIETWGSPERPAALGPDEFFVIGDFSLRSSDSRTWPDRGLASAPYALPRANIDGVATAIYWPPGRWRILR